MSNEVRAEKSTLTKKSRQAAETAVAGWKHTGRNCSTFFLSLFSELDLKFDTLLRNYAAAAAESARGGPPMIFPIF